MPIVDRLQLMPSSSPAMPPDAFDNPWTLPDSLRELAEEGNDDLVKEVLSVFRSDCTTRLSLLRAAVAAIDRPEIRRQAHTIKGSAAQVGAAEMASTCRNLEFLSADATPDQMATLLDRVELEFRIVRDAMARQYSE